MSTQAVQGVMPLIHDRPFQMRASAEFLAKVDDWRRKQPDLPSRAEAIRRLVEIALQEKPKSRKR
jgi:metal-responsive CopG/Arc/MetJ family transcriptional regulator